VAAGQVDRRLVATVDVSATIVEATGATLDTDGTSVMSAEKRTGVLLEGRKWQRLDGSVPHPAYCGLRTDHFLFVRYADGFEELYDYREDPFEARNRASDPVHAERVRSMRLRTLEGSVPTPPGFEP
jgi:hypothetical protein